MGEVFAYSIGSSLVLALLYFVYKRVLASESFHALNRTLVWLIYIVSLTALPIYLEVKKLFAHPTAVHFEIDTAGITNTVANHPEESVNLLPSIILWIYIAGMAVTLLFTAVSFIRIFRIIKEGKQVEIEGRKVILSTRENISPFSFGSYIVIPENESPENIGLILLHEQSHVNLHHWVDLLFAQAVCIFQWYNPAAWLMREEIKRIHEYQADRRVIESISDIREYQLLLIKKTVGARFPSLANSLYQSKLKKRIAMMCKRKPTRSSRLLRPILLVPALGAALWLTGQPAIASVIDLFAGSSIALPRQSAVKVTNFPSDRPTESEENSVVAAPAAVSPPVKSGKVTKEAVTEEEPSETPAAEAPATAVEKTAEYPGGMKALFEYLSSHLKSPGDDTPAGRVIVRMVIEANGEISDAEIVKGLSPSMDAEALRVVKGMPKWIPAEVGGKPVASYFTIPVKYEPVGDNVNIFVLPGGEKKDQGKTSASGSSNVMTSVSTSTNADGKTETTTVIASQDGDNKMSISVTSGEKSLKDYDVYVDGKKYTGNLNDIPSSKIESMSVDKTNGSTPIIRIKLKK